MSVSLPQHCPMTQFDVEDDCLLIGGMPLTRLAEQIGRTPFYAYDRQIMTRTVERLRRTLPEEIKLHYAVKANPKPDVVGHMASITDGLDVASAGELEVAVGAGTPRECISFAGPGKTHGELARAVAEGIVINMESERELTILTQLATETGTRPQVAIRVNPDFELKTSGMKMAGGPKPFGVDAERVPAMLDALANQPLDFRGFHIFSGSQNLRPEAICEAQQRTVELAVELAGHAHTSIRMLNIGGGFGIPYFPGDAPLALEPIAENLGELLPVVRKNLPDAELVIELGRYLVAESGIYVCQVLDRKISRGEVFLITDGGLHHHLAASGNFGQVIRKNYPVVVGNRVTGAAREKASVVGPLCTPLDLLADRMDLARAEPGDLIVVFQSGAYGLTASPTAFLSHPAPAEVLL